MYYTHFQGNWKIDIYALNAHTFNNIVEISIKFFDFFKTRFSNSWLLAFSFRVQNLQPVVTIACLFVINGNKIEITQNFYQKQPRSFAFWPTAKDQICTGKRKHKVLSIHVPNKRVGLDGSQPKGVFVLSMWLLYSGEIQIQ